MHVKPQELQSMLDRNPQLQLVKPSRQRENVSRETFWLLNVPPLAKPRMVKSDSWKKRPAVQRYWAWKDKITDEAHNQQLTLPATFRAIFFIAMPASWSKRKRNEMAGRQHEQTPDSDNLMKALKDALCVEDSHIWSDAPIKVWSYKPAIYIEAVKPQPLLDYAALIAGRYGL